MDDTSDKQKVKFLSLYLFIYNVHISNLLLGQVKRAGTSRKTFADVVHNEYFQLQFRTDFGYVVSCPYHAISVIFAAVLAIIILMAVIGNILLIWLMYVKISCS